MTHDEFNRLYDAGLISLKIWDGMDGETQKTVEACQYSGKYYLRVHCITHYKTGKRGPRGKCYAMTRESHYIKEFQTREAANRYFAKAAAGLRRIL